MHECGNWEAEHYNSVLEITRPHIWEYINWNQTFVLAAGENLEWGFVL
jgi:hypothetical protein